MSINLAQEGPLEAGPSTPLWSENFALVMTAPEQKVSLLYSIGTWYHDTSVWRENLALTLPDGQLLIGRNYGRNTKGNVVSASMARYEIIEADKQVRLTYDGPAWAHSLQDLLRPGAYGGKTRKLSLDIHFDATTPMRDMHAGHSEDRTLIVDQRFS